jgi:sRNA-binding protein
MSSTYRIERDRGIKEYRQQLAVLRQKWPLAFPVNEQDVRPLAVDAAHEIAAVMGWSYPYTLGVLSRWKMAPLYCQAVLSHPQRIALDGSPAQMVEAKAKDLATKHLARRAASTTAKKATKSAPAAVKSSAPPPSLRPETHRASLEKKPSTRLSHEPCLGVKVNSKRPAG